MGSSPTRNISSYIIHSQEEEIKRIAMELHEGVGQTLYSLLTQLQWVGTLEQPERKSNIKEMEQLLVKTIQEIRLLSVELHPPTLTTLGPVSAMRSYAKLYTSTFGIEVEIETHGEEVWIPERNSIALFRVCQEALANIARYADTSIAYISFTWDRDLLKVRIVDFGKGFDVEQAMDKSSGLAVMKERMLLAGGDCFISSRYGEGTIIDISLPIECR